MVSESQVLKPQMEGTVTNTLLTWMEKKIYQVKQMTMALIKGKPAM